MTPMRLSKLAKRVQSFPRGTRSCHQDRTMARNAIGAKATPQPDVPRSATSSKSIISDLFRVSSSDRASFKTFEVTASFTKNCTEIRIWVSLFFFQASKSECAGNLGFRCQKRGSIVHPSVGLQVKNALVTVLIWVIYTFRSLHASNYANYV